MFIVLTVYNEIKKSFEAIVLKGFTILRVHCYYNFITQKEKHYVFFKRTSDDVLQLLFLNMIEY